MERRKDLTGEEEEERRRKGSGSVGSGGATLSEDSRLDTVRLLNSEHHWLALPLAV